MNQCFLSVFLVRNGEKGCIEGKFRFKRSLPLKTTPENAVKILNLYSIVEGIIYISDEITKCT